MTSIRVRSGLFLLAALVAFPGLAVAKTGPARPEILDSRTEESSEVRGAMRVALESGVARAIYSTDFVARSAEPEAMAREYLAANRTLLGFGDASLVDLATRTTRRGAATTTVRFDQRVGGVPVDGAEVSVTLDRDHRVLFVQNAYAPGLESLSTTPAVDASVARAAALARLGVEGALSYDKTTLVFVPEADGARLAWKVKAVPQVSPTGDWTVLVDAATGEIFRVLDEACRLDGAGFVFDADPLSSAHVTYNTAGYTDGSDATTAQLDAQRVSVALRDITLNAGTYSLVGPYARIVDTESPFKGLFTQASSTFNFNRAADNFEAVNCYYHIDNTMRYINETLGIVLLPDEYVGGVKFDPHGLSGADNSHYLPSTGTLAFGEGGVDDAEDADVVIHELGHGIHDWITNGGLSQVNGLSEGVGDYFAQSYSRSLAQWASNESQYNWTFNWDGHNPFWSGRITNYSATYPGGLVNQVHSDGQIWATCLMRIWDRVGRDATDAAHIEGLAMTNASTNQNDAANAVALAAVALGLPGADVNAFVEEFTTTGYTVSANLSLTSYAGADECETVPSNANAIWEPGELVVVPVKLTSSLLTRTNAVGTLTTTTSGVTIVDDSATWPTLAPGIATETDAPHFTIRIDESVPCYTPIAFQLSVTTSETGPHVYAFSQSVGQSLTPTGLPAVIPNNNAVGLTSLLAVGENVPLTDVNVHVQITHNWIGDLKIQLVSPANTTITLLDRPGFPNSPNGCNNVNMDVTFDSASGVNLETHCAGTNPWYSGVGAPTQSLNVLNGQSSQGVWKLVVIDAVAIGNGTLVDWDLVTTPTLSSACDICPSATGAPIVAGRASFSLEPSRPNPFADSAEIRFSLASAGRATLRVYDVAGRHVATLVDADLTAGSHSTMWNGTDSAGRKVAGGLYFSRLTSRDGEKLARMQLVR